MYRLRLYSAAHAYIHPFVPPLQLEPLWSKRFETRTNDCGSMMRTTRTHENDRTTVRRPFKASMIGHVNELRVQALRRHHGVVWSLGRAWQRHGKAALLPWWNRRSTSPFPSQLALIPYLCPHLRRYPSPPPCPPFHVICVMISLFLLLLFCFMCFLEPQRQHRSRQPAESVCVMNHGVPTTMCMTHNGPSPTW